MLPFTIVNEVLKDGLSLFRWGQVKSTLNSKDGEHVSDGQ